MPAGVLATALLLRLIHLFEFRSSELASLLIGDAKGYAAWAQRLAAGDWLGSGVFYQSPLYPYLLGLLFSGFGFELLPVRLLQAVLGAAGCALVTVASTRLFGRTAGLVSGLGLALFAPSFFYESLIQKAALDFFLVSLLVFLLVPPRDGMRARRWLGIGLVLGLFCLNRENALLLFPLFLFWSGRVPARRAVCAAALTAGFALVLAPVALRSLAVGGQLQLTTSQFGPNLYIGNNAGADGLYHPLIPGRGSPEFERADAEALAEQATGRDLNAAEVSRHWQTRAFEWIRAQPRRWLALTAHKLLLLGNAREVMDTEDIYTHADHSTVLRAALPLFDFGLLGPLGLLGPGSPRPPD